MLGPTVATDRYWLLRRGGEMRIGPEYMESDYQAAQDEVGRIEADTVLRGESPGWHQVAFASAKTKRDTIAVALSDRTMRRVAVWKGREASSGVRVWRNRCYFVRQWVVVAPAIWRRYPRRHSWKTLSAPTL